MNKGGFQYHFNHNYCLMRARDFLHMSYINDPCELSTIDWNSYGGKHQLQSVRPPVNISNCTIGILVYIFLNSRDNALGGQPLIMSHYYKSTHWTSDKNIPATMFINNKNVKEWLWNIQEWLRNVHSGLPIAKCPTVFTCWTLTYPGEALRCPHGTYSLCIMMCSNSNILFVWRLAVVGTWCVSREYSTKLFGPMFYSCCNCPLRREKSTD